MAANWPDTSKALYTHAQGKRKIDRERTASEDLQRRIAERQQEDVEHTVELLRQLLALPEIADLSVELAWGFLDHGSLGRWFLGEGGWYRGTSHPGQWCGTPRFLGDADRPQGPIRSFKLTKKGLVHPGPGKDQWIQVDPSEHDDIVRRFNILDGQIRFLIKQITDHGLTN